MPSAALSAGSFASADDVALWSSPGNGEESDRSAVSRRRYRAEATQP
jgi:hypothetical protein